MRFLFVFVALFCVASVHAEEMSLNDALRATYTACVGIDDELADLKKMAGINTAITGAGTAAAGGATAVGLVKASKDAKASELEITLDKLREIESKNPQPTPSDADLMAFEQEFQNSYDKAVKEIEEYEAELNKLNKQSKSLGNWRTGLMAGSSVTNVAGAIIASKNGADGSIQAMIDDCRKAIGNLNNTIGQARMNGQDVSEATEIINACREYDTVNISAIEKRAKGAMVSSIVGATTGVAGTVTSIMANSDNVRDDNSDTGKQKEKNLNTASNVLAGTTAAASATATVFNATQISAIKKVAAVAEKCTGVLK